MKNILFALVVLVGLVATVHGACNQTNATTCAQEQVDSISAAGTDMSKKCSAMKTYISCLKDAGCESDSTYKETIVTLQKTIDTACGGSMVTVSIATMFLALFAMLFK